MRPEAIRDFLIRSASVIEKTEGVVSKDATLVNPTLTATSVVVATSLIQSPVTEDEELKFGEHVDNALAWYHGYNGIHDFTLSIKEQVTGAVKPNASIMVWALPVYEGELRRTKRVAGLREKILSAIDESLNNTLISGKVSGRCNVIDVVNSARGARVYHLVDIDTKRYLRYSAYGKTELILDANYAYNATVRNHSPDYQLNGLYVARLTLPRFSPILV